MQTRDALILTAIAVIIVIIVGCYASKRKGESSFCSGPYNLQLYDYPYGGPKQGGYPHYEAKAALSWDGDRRCAAWCSKSPCSIWCR